jgi:hypothetical protein
MTVRYSLSKASPESPLSFSYSAWFSLFRCDGSLTPRLSATGSISLFISVWSSTIFWAKVFTSSLAAFCVASLPNCTSAMPPCAALRRNILSLIICGVCPLSAVESCVEGVWFWRLARGCGAPEGFPCCGITSGIPPWSDWPKTAAGKSRTDVLSTMI